MPPALPDRYRLEVRLGRDADIEEWLGFDGVLDRPVLVRIVGADSPPDRPLSFLEGVRAAAGISHPHLAAVYSAGEFPGGAFAICEWVGGISMADRLRAGETLSPPEFLATAGGVAEALAILHEAGHLHGAVDPSALSYSLGHPAKLGGFGRPARSTSAAGEVADLAAGLEQALTGVPAGGPPPSEVVDGTPPAVDRALRQARQGGLTARGLAEALWAIPALPPPEAQRPEWSRRVLAVATVLVIAAAMVVGLGLLLGGGPALPEGQATTLPPPDAPAGGAVAVIGAQSFDPFGDNGTENEGGIAAVIDGDAGTSWRTERYRDPLPQLKAGVGFTVEVAGTPDTVEVVGLTEGTAYQLGWAADRAAHPGDWEVVAAGVAHGGTISVQVPPRTGGHWLVWLTDLPRAGEDDYSALVAEVRFRP